MKKVALPALYAPSPEVGKRTMEFFTAHIRNPHTRKAYFKAVEQFAKWCEEKGIDELHRVEPIMIAAYIEELGGRMSAPSIKQHLAAIRMLFDWLIVGGLLRVNPASAVRGPKHSVKKGKTPVLSADETRTLLDSIDTSSLIGLRDRALIALLTYTFARVGAAIKMKVEDVYVQRRRTWVRLHEKGGKRHEMPCHHTLDEYLTAYIEGAQLSPIAKGCSFAACLGKPDSSPRRELHKWMCTA
jgi:site-specific recombinase XerD